MSGYPLTPYPPWSLLTPPIVGDESVLPLPFDLRRVRGPCRAAVLSSSMTGTQTSPSGWVVADGKRGQAPSLPPSLTFHPQGQLRAAPSSTSLKGETDSTHPLSSAVIEEDPVLTLIPLEGDEGDGSPQY